MPDGSELVKTMATLLDSRTGTIREISVADARRLRPLGCGLLGRNLIDVFDSLASDSEALLACLLAQLDVAGGVPDLDALAELLDADCIEGLTGELMEAAVPFLPTLKREGGRRLLAAAKRRTELAEQALLAATEPAALDAAAADLDSLTVD